MSLLFSAVVSNIHKRTSESLDFQRVPVISETSVTNVWVLEEYLWHPTTVLGYSDPDVWTECYLRNKRMDPYVWLLCLQVQLSENLNCSEKKKYVFVLSTLRFLKITIP